MLLPLSLPATGRVPKKWALILTNQSLFQKLEALIHSFLAVPAPAVPLPSKLPFKSLKSLAVLFAADPTSIILPQTSTLSWSCSYADICSIDQGVGSVNPISGSQQVRPSATTTYTLTCNGSDGERTWQSTVNVGFTPRVREVAP